MFSKNGTFELQLLFMKLDFLSILGNYYLSIFFVQRWIESGCICPEWTSGTCMVSASLSPMPKSMLGIGTLSSAHVKIARIKGTFVGIESIRSHLITRGFMPNYTIWTMYDEVDVQEDDDDVDMPDVAI